MQSMPTTPIREIILKNQKRLYILLMASIAFVLGVLVWPSIWNKNNLRIDEKHFTYTNPALDYVIWEAIMNTKDINLEGVLSWYIRQKTLANETTHVSVYFRNLNNGNWFGIHEREIFSPASLMKLPLLMAYLKWLQNEPGIFDIKLPFIPQQSTHLYTQDIPPEKTLEPSKEYTVKELIEHMIIYSDNHASTLLEQHVPPQAYQNVFLENGFPFPEQAAIDGDLQITIVDYAALFRILFNASYIDKKLSSYALRLLAKSTFNEWLIAGVPSHIKVSHKFGERGKEFPDGRVEKQLLTVALFTTLSIPISYVLWRGETIETFWNRLSQIFRNSYTMK